MGYFLLATTVVLGVSFAAFTVREFRDPGVVVRVRFPAISTLSAGDPVVENGVEAGRVRSITLDDGGSAIVELRLDQREPPARDSRFVNFSHSLMGARKVWIHPGDSPLPLDVSRVQEGVFVPGLPETLHRVRLLNERIAAWGEALDNLLGGGDSAAALRAVGGMERALMRLARLETSLQGAAADLRTGVEDLSSLERKALASARDADASLGGAAMGATSAREAVARVEADLAAFLSRLEAIAVALDADTGMAGRLLADRRLYDSLVDGVEKLTAMTRDLRQEGLGDSLRIRPRFFGRGGR